MTDTMPQIATDDDAAQGWNKVPPLPIPGLDGVITIRPSEPTENELTAPIVVEIDGKAVRLLPEGAGALAATLGTLTLAMTHAPEHHYNKAEAAAERLLEKNAFSLGLHKMLTGALPDGDSQDDGE